MNKELLKYDIIVVGGGAAGFFTAINVAERRPDLTVAILERGKTGLQKVKISGGGRCNVTHAEFIPSELVYNYPRGKKELLGPFHTFMTGDTITWFQDRGVSLKTEDDGRMFPVSNSSQTIIDCFLSEAKKHSVDVCYNQSVKAIKKIKSVFHIETKTDKFQCENLIVSTGSNQKIWNLLEDLGHTIIPPVPSLFTFDIKDKRIKDIPGVVAKDVIVKVLNTNLESEGPLLITHVGLSAPSILKLSAYGAIELAKFNYKFKISINFIKQDIGACVITLQEFKIQFAKKIVANAVPFDLPKRLWRKLIEASEINENERWAELNKSQILSIAQQLTNAVFQVNGKSTFKEEFVTAGGVDLKEINFKTFESRVMSNLYFAGEVINVDAVTGGFNFQNAWTSGFIVSKSIT